MMVKDQTLLNLCACIEVVATSCNNVMLARRANRLHREIASLFKDPDFLREISK